MCGTENKTTTLTIQIKDDNVLLSNLQSKYTAQLVQYADKKLHHRHSGKHKVKKNFTVKTWSTD